MDNPEWANKVDSYILHALEFAEDPDEYVVPVTIRVAEGNTQDFSSLVTLLSPEPIGNILIAELTARQLAEIAKLSSVIKIEASR